MIVLPKNIREKIERCVAGLDGPKFGIDDEARQHGAIALMGTLGAIWGLRPDGTFWEFDFDFDVPLTPLPEDRELLAIAYGAERHEWLKPLLPARPNESAQCPHCLGNRKFPVTVGFTMCSTCHGLGWLA